MLRCIIRSRGRPALCKELSARQLKENQIFDKTYICATEGDPEISGYKRLCKDFGFGFLVAPEGNICDKNNYCLSLWPESGDLVVLADDGIKSFIEFPYGHKRHRKIKDGGKQIRELYIKARLQGLERGIFSVGPSYMERAYFSEGEIYLVKKSFFAQRGGFQGWICKAPPENTLQKIFSKNVFQEDIERGIQFLMRDGFSLRLFGFRYKTAETLKQRENEGAGYTGIYSNISWRLRSGDHAKDRAREQEKAVRRLAKDYPLFVKAGKPSCLYRAEINAVMRNIKKLEGIKPNALFFMNEVLKKEG